MRLYSIRFIDGRERTGKIPRAINKMNRIQETKLLKGSSRIVIVSSGSFSAI